MKKKIDKWELTKAEAKKIINVSKGMVHTFYNAPWGLIGGDHSLSSIKRDLKNAYLIKKTGEQSLNMGHGIVIMPSEKCKQSDLLFIETIESFNKKELSKLKQEGNSSSEGE